MKEYDYELCEQCEKNMIEAGVMGLTTEQMMEQQAEFKFDLALILMEEGYVVASETLKNKMQVEGLIITHDIQGYEVFSEFGAVNEEGEVVSYINLPTQAILAEDWRVIGKIEG